MMHLGYFSLLLFCISTNMILGMYLTQNVSNTQTEKKTDYLWGWDSISFNETRDDSILLPLDIITPEELMRKKNTSFSEQQNPFGLDPNTITFCSGDAPSKFLFPGQESLTNPEKFSNSFDIFTGRSFTTNTPYNPEPRNLSISSSSSAQQSPLSSTKDIYDLMDLTKQTPDTDTEKFFNNEFQQTNSLSKQQIAERPKNPNYHSQQSIPQNFLTSSDKTELPVSSDNKYSTVFDRKYFSETKSSMPSDSDDDESSIVFEQKSDETKFMVHELLIKRKDNNCSTTDGQKIQRPRKKRKINVPSTALFTITCNHCSDKPQFQSPFKNSLLQNVKNHFNKKHPTITNKQTKNYIEKHLQKPKQLAKFSIDCPAKCGYIASSCRRSSLKANLFWHVLKSKEHQNIRNKYSKNSLAMHIDNNCKTILVVSEQKQLLSKFSIDCIESRCDHTVNSTRKSGLTNSLSKHLNFVEHQGNYKFSEIKTYVQRNYKQTPVPTLTIIKKIQKNTKNVPNNTNFTHMVQVQELEIENS